MRSRLGSGGGGGGSCGCILFGDDGSIYAQVFTRRWCDLHSGIDMSSADTASVAVVVRLLDSGSSSCRAGFSSFRPSSLKSVPAHPEAGTVGSAPVLGGYFLLFSFFFSPSLSAECLTRAVVTARVPDRDVHKPAQGFGRVVSVGVFRRHTVAQPGQGRFYQLPVYSSTGRRLD